MLPSFYQVPRKWATQHARPMTDNPNPDRARRASTKASAPAPIVPKPAGTITLFEADPTTPTAEVSAEVVQTTARRRHRYLPQSKSRPPSFLKLSFKMPVGSLMWSCGIRTLKATALRKVI